jgi:hypothetical protein
MTYQDPNDPTHPKTVNATINGQGYLSFTDAGPTGLGTVLITAGFAESPNADLIPEPGTMSLLLAPIGGIWLLKRRRAVRA